MFPLGRLLPQVRSLMAIPNARGPSYAVIWMGATCKLWHGVCVTHMGSHLTQTVAYLPLSMAWTSAVLAMFLMTQTIFMKSKKENGMAGPTLLQASA